MDDLTAMRYAVTAADTLSFTAAATKLGVSTPAVSKLLTVLEEKYATAFFVRRARGISLTAQGEQFVHDARIALAHMDRIKLSYGADANKARGTLIIATTPELSVLSWLQNYHRIYPDMQVEIRHLSRKQAISAIAADVYLLLGWPDDPDLIEQHILQTRMVTCAAPSYWQRYGIPTTAEDLKSHNCLTYAVDGLNINDLWRYRRGREAVNVVARGWLQSNSRPATIMAAVRADGVLRIPDVLIADELRTGRLIAALGDWTGEDAPPLRILYGAEQRNNARLRLFREFLTRSFAEIQQSLGPASIPRLPVDRPYWHQRTLPRASEVPTTTDIIRIGFTRTDRKSNQ
jgi:DNA-binding transcriptional LysR family regulator